MGQTNNYAAIIAAIGIFVGVATPVVGYILTSLRGNINHNEKLSIERNQNLRELVRDAETRLTASIRSAEQRAERGDERVQAMVNSQFSEINAQLRELRDNVQRLLMRDSS